jgi:hypothetical protein
MSENPLRRARATINLYKLKKVFGLLTFKGEQSLEETLNIVKVMHSEYLNALKLDGKPEKGERKMADDLILLINEVLKPFSDNN